MLSRLTRINKKLADINKLTYLSLYCTKSVRIDAVYMHVFSTKRRRESGQRIKRRFQEDADPLKFRERSVFESTSICILFFDLTFLFFFFRTTYPFTTVHSQTCSVAKGYLILFVNSHDICSINVKYAMVITSTQINISLIIQIGDFVQSSAHTHFLLAGTWQIWIFTSSRW